MLETLSLEILAPWNFIYRDIAIIGQSKQNASKFLHTPRYRNYRVVFFSREQQVTSKAVGIILNINFFTACIETFSDDIIYIDSVDFRVDRSNARKCNIFVGYPRHNEKYSGIL